MAGRADDGGSTARGCLARAGGRLGPEWQDWDAEVEDVRAGGVPAGR